MSTEHRIAIEPSPKRVRAVVGGETLADSLAALLLLEAEHGPVYYFPRSNVQMDLLQATDHHSHCPYKGDASYWSIAASGRTVENAVWSYENPPPLPSWWGAISPSIGRRSTTGSRRTGGLRPSARSSRGAVRAFGANCLRCNPLRKGSSPIYGLNASSLQPTNPS